ncbi:O-antigen ligase family protein [Ideonella sp. 4Y11]|uniref:O-antigen ligase family protein n=1 Tax=Ideonella aquatica TaxID=2824119 RepID=A0A940YHR2_9BURK|nr:O-antigen ligase family protein [Ideonella aquatica]MBQ0958341.1 O-antigen ligase family protein [Ideonella aquatica]
MADLSVQWPQSSTIGRGADAARSMLMALALMGYPLVAALAGIAGLGESSAPSIALRVGVVVLAIYVLFERPLRITHGLGWFIVGTMCFWSAYLGRILVDGFARDMTLQLSGSEYLAYAVMFSLLPACGALQGPPEPTRSTLLLRRLVLLGLLTMLLAALAYLRSLSDLQSALQGRAGLEKLNPISLGHLGVSLFLLSCVLLACGPSGRGSIWVTAAAMLTLVLGAVAVGMAGSKGPFVALLVAASAYLLAPMRGAQRLRWIVAGALVLGVLAVALVNMGDQLESVQLLARLADLLSGQSADESTTSRMDAYQSAIDQFSESPIYGDALVERIHHYYPHNAILEVAMATGLMGLLPFLAIVLASMIQSWRALAQGGEGRWIHMLNIQYFVAAIFSGGVFSDSQMWFFLLLCYASSQQGSPPRASALPA